MTLVEQSQQFVDLLDRRNRLEKDKSQSVGFKGRRELFESVVKDLEPIVSSLRALRSKGIISGAGELSAEAGEVLKLAKTIKKNFDARPNWILQPPEFSLQLFQQTLSNLRNGILFSVRESWANYTVGKVPKIDRELLAVLKDIGDLGRIVGRIGVLSTRIEKERAKVPKSEEEVADFEDLVSELIKAWDSLESDEMPQSVRVFLKEATSGGAPLPLLTDEVLSWLNNTRSTLSQKPLSESFRVISLARLQG